MRLIQFETHPARRAVGVVTHDCIEEISGAASVRDLALEAIAAGRTLSEYVQGLPRGERHDYARIRAEGRLLPPLDHPDPAHCMVTGTGLTHLGSATARDKMHQQQESSTGPVTDSMRCFQWGLEGGRPESGQIGAQPEWFYKGDGHIVVAPGQPLVSPEFAEDSGEEPELTGLYVIGPDRHPYRVGFAVGNEFSDHVTERQNYLYLAHSKLRACSFGPELRLGELPRHLAGFSRIRRNHEVIWEQEFLSGEDNMCHSIENLEYHHFKYTQFLQPGDVHIHFFGTATLSFADGIRTQPGDQFEIGLPDFGEPLCNPLQVATEHLAPGRIKAL